MEWLFLVLSTTWLGYEAIPYFKVNDLNFVTRICSGWLLGSLFTGLVVYITSYIIPMGYFHSMMLSIGSVFGASILKRKGAKSSISIEKNPWFWLLLVFTAGYSLRHLSMVYKDIPHSIPHGMISVADDEISFINSLLIGCNRKRKNPFFFKDPRIFGKSYNGYAIPLLYTASLQALRSNYGTASLVICFMNIMSSVVAAFYFCKKYTKWPVLASFLLLFSGSWAALLFYKSKSRMDPKNDLVHTILENHNTIWYHPINQLLSFSKASSFSVATGLFAIYWQQSALGYILAAIVPSITTSASLMLLFFSMPHKVKYLIYAGISQLVRMHPFPFRLFPIYREAEMRGTFFAQIYVWLQALGPVFFVVIGFIWFLPKTKFKAILIATIAPTVILQFIREGNDHINNATAFCVVFVPIVMTAFTEIMRKFISWVSDPEYKGTAAFLLFFLSFFMLFGGFINSKRIINGTDKIFEREDIEAVSWLKEFVPPYETVFAKPSLIGPLTICGYQQFLGDKLSLHTRGVKIAKQLDDLSEISGKNCNSAVLDKYNIHYVLKDVRWQPFEASVESEVVKRNEKYVLMKILSSPKAN